MSVTQKLDRVSSDYHFIVYSIGAFLSGVTQIGVRLQVYVPYTPYMLLFLCVPVQEHVMMSYCLIPPPVHCRCDADPAALAKYVVALLRKDKPKSALKELCIDQLEVFLAKGTGLVSRKRLKSLSMILEV